MQAWYVKLDRYSVIQYSGRNNSVCSKGAFSICMYLSAYNSYKNIFNVIHAITFIIWRVKIGSISAHKI